MRIRSTPINYWAAAGAAAFKYFDCKGVNAWRVRHRSGARGTLTLRLTWDGEPISSVPIGHANIWEETDIIPVEIPDGIHALYFGFEGSGAVSLGSFTLYTE